MTRRTLWLWLFVTMKKLRLTKRKKFGLIVLSLTAFFLVIQLAPFSWRYPLILALVSLTYLLCVWGLYEDLDGIEWLTLFIMPVGFVTSLSLFYFLLPQRFLTRLPITFLFALGMYAVLLIENIYNVAAERTIALLRAAHSVGLLITLFTYFLFLALILSFHLNFFQNAGLTFLVSFPLILQSLWAMKLEPNLTKELLVYSFVLSLSLGELAFTFSFWPIPTIVEALFLTTVFYSLVGMVQQLFLERFFKKTVREFLTVSGLVFLLVLIATHWG